MSQEHNFTGYLGSDFQLKVLWQLLTESEFAEKTIPLLEIDYFDDATLKRFFSILTQYAEDNEKPCGLQNKSVDLAINKYSKRSDETEKELLFAVVEKIKNYNDMVLNKRGVYDGDVVQKETLTFIKQQEYRKLADYINTKIRTSDKSEDILYPIEERIKKISEIGEEDDIGIEIMENVSRALQPEFRKTIPTGIEHIDILTKGGLGGGEIGIILAPSGVGKSTILTKISNTAYAYGKNVLQIIFEDNEDDIRRKHFSIWSGVPLSEIDENIESVKNSIFSWHKTHEYGRLIIKKFSQEDTTIPKIRQYIDRYEKKTGIKFDIIVLDYIDCVEPHKRSVDQNSAELQIIKAFEAMSIEYNIPCWTAIQANRTGFNAEVVETSQMGGNIKRAQKTHFLMSIAKSPEQKRLGQANIAILKARMAQDGHIFKDCIFDNNTMEIKITDELPPSTQKMLNDNKIDEEKLTKLNDKFSKSSVDEDTQISEYEFEEETKKENSDPDSILERFKEEENNDKQAILSSQLSNYREFIQKNKK